jgi:hypothetical protein
MGVMSKSIFKGLAGCLLNAAGRIKVRLADFQMDDAGAFTLKFLGPLKHIHYNEGCHFFGTL